MNHLVSGNRLVILAFTLALGVSNIRPSTGPDIQLSKQYPRRVNALFSSPANVDIQNSGEPGLRLATVAPTIATALGGPLAGLAIGAIGSVFGLSDATQEQVAQAIARAEPNDLMLLKKAELDFKTRMAELQVDIERIAAQDRDSARDREGKVKDRTPQVLATLIVGGYCYVQWFLLQHVVPTEMRDIVMRMLGLLDGALMMVLSYYFGSNANSRAKNATIANLSE